MTEPLYGLLILSGRSRLMIRWSMVCMPITDGILDIQQVLVITLEPDVYTHMKHTLAGGYGDASEA